MLMAYRIPTLLGYHGNELRFYDELGGKDRAGRTSSAPNLLDLLALALSWSCGSPSRSPDSTRWSGPVSTAFGTSAVLYERDTLPPYARVVRRGQGAGGPDRPDRGRSALPGAAGRAVLRTPPRSRPTPLRQPLPASRGDRPQVTSGRPGRMTHRLDGTDPKPSYLLVAENWYPDWHATVDGSPAPVLPRRPYAC